MKTRCKRGERRTDTSEDLGQDGHAGSKVGIDLLLTATEKNAVVVRKTNKGGKGNVLKNTRIEDVGVV